MVNKKEDEKRFKVGDIVKVTGNTNRLSDRLLAMGLRTRHEYTVDGTYEQDIYLNEIYGRFNSDMFELVKKDEFRVDDVVEFLGDDGVVLKKGCYYIVKEVCSNGLKLICGLMGNENSIFQRSNFIV